MSPEAQRIAIAEACGLNTEREQVGGVFCYRNKEGHMIAALPDYLNDLNAMAQAEKLIPVHKRGFYNTELSKSAVGGRNLSCVIKEPDWIFELLNATAAQRAEAFLKAVGKWEY